MKRGINFRSRAICQKTGQLIDVLCLFFGRTPIDMSVIDDEIQNAIKTRLPLPDAILLLSFGDQARNIASVWTANPERTESLISRGRTAQYDYLKELSIWEFSAGNFKLLLRDQNSKASYDLDIPQLVRNGLSALVDERQAFQIAPSGHVFRHPSKRQSKYFLLASELVRDEVDAYFVALCICQVAWARLSRVHTLHIDTMGIYAVARAIECIVSTCGGTFREPWQIVNFHSHDGVATLHAVVDDEQAVLISASTSGSMAGKLADSGVPETGLITVLDVSSRNRRCTVIYARDQNPDVVTSIEEPKFEAATKETVIELTGEYFVATGKKPRSLLLSIVHKPEALNALLTQFGASAVCSLNKRRPGATPTVDLLSIDGDSVAANEKVKSWLNLEIRSKTPVSVSHILHLQGAGSNTFANHCADSIEALIGRRPVMVELQDLTSLQPKSVSGILICSALVGNGHALRSASRDLRESLPKASRHFVVGVGLPSSEEAWTRLRQFLTVSDDPSRPYIFSHWKVLPTGAESGEGEAWKRATLLMQQTEQMQVTDESPWSKELIEESLRAAGDALQNAESGFLTTSAGATMTLTRGFVYWSPDSEDAIAGVDPAATSYLAMSSALQNAREIKDHSRQLRSSLHETVVLDPENFLRFNDGVLQASLLRAAKSHELNYSSAPEQSEILREFLEKVFVNHERSYGEASMEFAFAFASGQLRLTKGETEKLFVRLGTELKVPSALLGLIYCAWVASKR